MERIQWIASTNHLTLANLPRTCPQHLGTKPGSVAHGNLFFGSGTNLNDGYLRPCYVRRHGNPAHFTSGWIRVCALLRLELTTSECYGPLSHYRFFYQRTKPAQCFLKSTPELRPLTPSAQNPAREPLTPRMGYPMRFITAVGAWFACASMAMLDCVMIWLRVNCIISPAMSASRTTDSDPITFSRAVRR